MTVARVLPARTTNALARRRPSHTDALLLVVCLAQFMVILDVSIVNVALPSIDSGLHFSATGLQWVVNAYTLAFAGFLMLGGRCADLLGRRRVFLLSTALFAASSLACALADSRELLIGARALQGFAGAMMSPATLSIITSSLEEGAERNRGLGIWGAMGALGASSGALLGGILTQELGWQAIFAVNVPLGALVVALGLRFIPTARVAAVARHFDATGAVLVTASLVSITYGIVQSDTLGWGSVGVLGPLVAGLLLLAAFLFVEGSDRNAPARPARRLPNRPAAHREPRRRAAVRRLLPGVVLPHALPPAGARLQRDRRRPRVPADDALDHGLPRGSRRAPSARSARAG